MMRARRRAGSGPITPTDDATARLIAALESPRDVDGVYGPTSDAGLDRELTMAARRRRGPAAAGLEAPTLTLVEAPNGVLRFERDATVGVGAPPSAMRRRRRAGDVAATRPDGFQLTDLHFKPFPPNALGKVLAEFDGARYPRASDGLRAVVRTPSGTFAVADTDPAPSSVKRARVIVHGTASSGLHIVDELVGTADGKAFLRALTTTGAPPLYVFNHPTLSVSPFLNAFDLEVALQRFLPNATIDIVCHSRGGLVTRWWSELAVRDPGRVGTLVFVGAPLAGTSLAAPGALKQLLDDLANTARAVMTVSGAAGAMVPALAPITSLIRIIARVFTTMTSVVTHTPVADVAIAAVPGLAAMSQVEGNPEAARLLDLGPSFLPTASWYGAHSRYVAADFQPADPGLKIWRYITDRPLLRVGAAVGDRLFPGAHDLVVDTASMNIVRRDAFSVATLTKGLPVADGKTHHTNYFQNPVVLAKVSEWLLQPGT